MKAIIVKNETYKMTGERGDFFICEDSKNKVRMFAKNAVEVIEIEEMPKVKVYPKREKNSVDPNFVNHFKDRLKYALEQEHGRTGLTLEQLKRL